MIRVRGAESSQTKVYIDGIPAFTMNGVVSQSATDFSTIPADNIKKLRSSKDPVLFDMVQTIRAASF